MDISDVILEAYTAPGCEFDEGTAVNGFIVDPKSDEKEIFIPSPPTKMITKTNPRAGIIYLTAGSVPADHPSADAIKAMCKEQKFFLAAPLFREEEEDALNDIQATYDWMIAKAKTLNVKTGEISVKADEAYTALAAAFVERMSDEYDVELSDPEALAI